MGKNLPKIVSFAGGTARYYLLKGLKGKAEITARPPAEAGVRLGRGELTVGLAEQMNVHRPFHARQTDIPVTGVPGLVRPGPTTYKLKFLNRLVKY